MKFAKRLIAVGTLAFIHTAQAQSFQSKPYFGIEFGAAQVENRTAEFTKNPVSRVGGSAAATQDTSLKNIKIIGGYKINENFDVEVGYWKTSKLDSKYSGVDRHNVSYTGIRSDEFSGFEYAAIIRPDLSSGWNNAYLKLGGHKTNFHQDVHATDSTGGSASLSSSSTASGALVGIGYDLPIAENTSLRLALTRYSNIAGISGALEFISVGALYKF